ncbi:hypothetical protein ACN28S_06980 [Cystobacter fuscus]
MPAVDTGLSAVRDAATSAIITLDMPNRRGVGFVATPEVNSSPTSTWWPAARTSPRCSPTGACSRWIRSSPSTRSMTWPCSSSP